MKLEECLNSLTRRELRHLIPIGVVYYIRQNIVISNFSLIVLGIFFVLFYGLLILITKSLDKNDLYIIKEFLGKIKRKGK